MATLCTICQDFLTERPQMLPAANELIMCALKCGHMFHRICVEQWFQARRESVFAVHERREACPCCLSAASLETALRIYPTGDDESDAIVRQVADLKSVNETLTITVNEVRDQLQHVESELEGEMVGHDMLKMEYVKLLSKSHALQEHLNECKNVNRVTENSIKSALEKSESERKDAFNKIIEMEDKLAIQQMQIMQYTNAMEELRKKDVENQSKIQSLQATLFNGHNVSELELEAVNNLETSTNEESDGDGEVPELCGQSNIPNTAIADRPMLTLCDV